MVHGCGCLILVFQFEEAYWYVYIHIHAVRTVKACNPYFCASLLCNTALFQWGTSAHLASSSSAWAKCAYVHVYYATLKATAVDHTFLSCSAFFALSSSALFFMRAFFHSGRPEYSSSEKSSSMLSFPTSPTVSAAAGVDLPHLLWGVTAGS